MPLAITFTAPLKFTSISPALWIFGFVMRHILLIPIYQARGSEPWGQEHLASESVGSDRQSEVRNWLTDFWGDSFSLLQHSLPVVHLPDLLPAASKSQDAHTYGWLTVLFHSDPVGQWRKTLDPFGFFLRYHHESSNFSVNRSPLSSYCFPGHDVWDLMKEKALYKPQSLGWGCKWLFL